MNRTIRIILVILMMFWLFWIPSILYLLWAKPKGGSLPRFVFWILTLIPGLSLIGGILLLLVEFRIINVDQR
ncbi:hypothetical protein [Malacoplasma muris]|uniref:hypothetical protein n=1 Tax=Malacoplasma muris TaxID=2119 RepID=UPI00398E439B